MAVAGYCRSCGQYVWLNEQWGCVNGHPWTELSNWYDPQTGTPVTPYWLQPAPVAAAPAPTPMAPQPVAPAYVAPQPLAPEPAAPAYVAPIPEPAPVVEPAPAPQPMPAPVPVPAPAAAPAPAPEPAPAAAPAPAPTASDRLTLLADILATFSARQDYSAQYGTDTDLVIGNEVANMNWGTGKKKVEFSAIMKAVEPELTLYYWEMLKESSAGLSFGGFEAETSGFSGTSWGKTKEVVIGPDGSANSYEWDYAATRKLVEEVASRHGWQVKVVLAKNSAQW